MSGCDSCTSLSEAPHLKITHIDDCDSDRIDPWSVGTDPWSASRVSGSVSDSCTDLPAIPQFPMEFIHDGDLDGTAASEVACG